jgi:hypothetical protein
MQVPSCRNDTSSRGFKGRADLWPSRGVTSRVGPFGRFIRPIANKGQQKRTDNIIEYKLGSSKDGADKEGKGKERGGWMKESIYQSAPKRSRSKEKVLSLLAPRLTETPHAYRISAQSDVSQWGESRGQVTYILKDKSSSLLGQVALQVLCWLAKSRIAVTDPSNQGLLPRLSGNHPLVPPAARSRIK